MAILDCIQGLHFDGSEDTLPISPSLSRSSLLCSSLTLSPTPRSHYFGIVFVTASYDAIIDLSKKQNTLCKKKKKTKNWPQDFKGKIPTHTHTHRRLFGSKKCGKFGNAHWCALRCEIVTIVLAIVAQATAHCLEKEQEESKYTRAVPSLALTALKGHVNGMNASPSAHPDSKPQHIQCNCNTARLCLCSACHTHTRRGRL